MEIAIAETPAVVTAEPVPAMDLRLLRGRPVDGTTMCAGERHADEEDMA